MLYSTTPLHSSSTDPRAKQVVQSPTCLKICASRPSINVAKFFGPSMLHGRADQSIKGVINFVRSSGDLMHIMIRRYRFIEGGLRIGKAERKQL